MPPDARDEEVADWLARATQELRAADVDLAADPPLGADAAFHCQQAVEKALKAMLTWCDEPFRMIHDLGELGRACALHEPPLEPLLREAAPLTEYAWRFRYPGGAFEPDLEEVVAALDVARRVVEAVRSRTA